MNKVAIIDNKMREFEIDYLKKEGYSIIKIPGSDRVYEEISSHVDIFITKLNDTLIIENSKYMYLKNELKRYGDYNIISGCSSVCAPYPLDIGYNICQIGTYVIHNFKYTDDVIKNYIKENNLTSIQINQGYSKCSIAKIDNNSAIVSDKKIYEKLKEHGIDVLLIDNALDIKLLDNKGKYSNMKGFIGGCISKIGEKIMVCGDLNKIDKDKRIREFINKKKIEVIDFKGHDVIDYGGILDITF